MVSYLTFHGSVRKEAIGQVIPEQRHISACLSRRRAIVFDRTPLTVFVLRRVHVALFFLVYPAST